MAALSGNRPTVRQGGVDNGPLVSRIGFLVEDNVHIYQGAMVQLNASGYAVPAGTAYTADTHLFTTAGRAMEEIDNTLSGHTQGGKTVQVDQGAFSWDNDGANPVVQADVLKTCYALDDHTVSHDANTNTSAAAGKVLGLMNIPELGDQVIVQTASV